MPKLCQEIMDDWFKKRHKDKWRLIVSEIKDRRYNFWMSKVKKSVGNIVMVLNKFVGDSYQIKNG